MDQYLAASEFIDWDTPAVLTKALSLAAGTKDKTLITQRCFEYVRDKIKHSHDFRLNPVTCKASEVLAHGTGWCYAKSHLLAALLRANKIPAALCYQRLTITNNRPPFCLHGLNAVFLQPFGWYRLDPRGNKPGVCALFSPPTEHFAFPIAAPGEYHLAQRYSEPLPEVIRCLLSHQTYSDVLNNLPDAK